MCLMALDKYENGMRTEKEQKRARERESEQEQERKRVVFLFVLGRESSENQPNIILLY